MRLLPTDPSDSVKRRNPHLWPSREMTSSARAAELLAAAPVEARCERDLHDDIERYCRERGYLVCHSRMDMASTIAVGWPDFVVFMPCGKACFLECKVRGAKATTEQLAKLTHARKLGFTAEIVNNLEDAVKAMFQALDL
jgi:hypothetical protein